jgi:hypothetical protein
MALKGSGCIRHAKALQHALSTTAKPFQEMVGNGTFHGKLFTVIWDAQTLGMPPANFLGRDLCKWWGWWHMGRMLSRN